MAAEKNKVHPTRNRSSHQRCPIRTGVLENDAKFTKNVCVGAFLLIKLQDGDLQLYSKKDYHRSFPATALAEWLVPMWYYTELRSILCDVNFLIMKTLYCNFVSLKTSSAKVDEISQER